jgi:hypothetical protein
MEILDVTGQTLDGTILRCDNYELPAQNLGQSSDEQSSRTSRKARNGHARITTQGIGCDAAKVRHFGNSCQDLMNPFFE